MRVQALTLGLALMFAAGTAAHAQSTPPENPGPAIQGNSDPAMPAKMKPMGKKKMMVKKKAMKKKM